MTCQRPDPTTTCLRCPARAGEACPLADEALDWVEEKDRGRANAPNGTASLTS